MFLSSTRTRPVIALLLVQGCSLRGDQLTRGPTETPRVDAGNFPRVDAGRHDAGTIPPFWDAGRDASVICQYDWQCDDGLACNGREVCGGGRCTNGAPPACGDGTACTIDACVEPDGLCRSEPDHGYCGSGTCVPGRGCVGSSCPVSPCDPVTQCGCPGGAACLVNAFNLDEILCGDPGLLGVGAVCDSTYDCELGLSCIAAVCRRPCRSTGDCDGDHCLEISPGEWGICDERCEPFPYSLGCPSSTQCGLLFGDVATITACLPEGQQGPGESCAPGAGTCGPGLTCVTFTNGAETCEWGCDAAQGTAFNAACSVRGISRCQQFNNLPSGGRRWGYCPRDEP